MIDPNDIQLSLLDKHPKGGQHAGTRPTGMRVLHKPTGIVIEVPPDAVGRSQYKTRTAILDALLYLLLDIDK